MNKYERIINSDRWIDSHPLTKLAEGAADLLSKTRERLFEKEVEVVYGFPVRQDNLTKYFDPDFFAGLDNPLDLKLYEIAQGLVEQARRQPGVYEAKSNSHRFKRGKAIISTEHASDLAKPWNFNYDERVIAITGLELLMTRLMATDDTTDQEFTHLYYEDKEISLGEENGTSAYVNEIFDQLPNPIPAGSVLSFANGEYILEVKVLPIPDKKFVVPQLSFIGAEERSNLDRNLRAARINGGRIMIVFKEGQEGLVKAFAQGNSAVGIAVYELDQSKKGKVKSVDGVFADMKTLPLTEPGKAQVVLMPIKGKIEGFIRDTTDAIIKGSPPTPIQDLYGVYGIDVIETGSSASQARVVPVDFRHDRSHHIKAKTVLDWYKNNKKLYLEYVRANAIMPVQPVAIRVRRKSA